MITHKFFLFLLFCVCISVNAQTVKLVVPFSAGGIVDRAARGIEKTLTNKLPYNFAVEYQLGAAGIIAANNVAKNHSKETVLLVHSSAIATNTFNPNSTYDLVKDFVPIAKLGSVPMVLVFNRQTGIASIKQLRQTNVPMFYATSGPGSASHVAGELLENAVSKDLTPVFYKGESAAFNDILSSNVTMMFMSASVVTSYINSSQLYMTAITGTQRNPALPDVPTFFEQGIRNFDRSPNWIVVLSNPGADPIIIAKIKNALAESFANTQDQGVYRRVGLEPNSYLTTNVREFLMEEVERIRPFQTKLQQ
jgi:tripartite-type tricarboxylate transporter receptor subunit TctC